MAHWNRSLTCTASGGAVVDSLAVDQRTVPADYLHPGVRPQPGGQLLGVAAGPQLDRQAGVGIHQEGAVLIRVQSEVVHAQHPRGRNRRERQAHHKWNSTLVRDSGTLRM